jgi:acyl-CoA synthetase (AMP-forming)/AMP-acid ligase II
MIDATTLDELVRRRAEGSPDADVLRARGEHLSARELDERTRRVASALASAGVAPGDRVALVAENGIDFFVSWIGVVRAGAVVVPAHTSLRARDLGHVLRHSGARIVLADAASAPNVLPAAAAASVADVWIDLGRARGAPAGTPRAAAAGDVVALQYTSGTTGLPKGCMLTHESWLHLAYSAAAWAPFGPADVALTAQPASYMDPMWNLFLALVVGMPLVVLPRFSASTFWRSVADEGATFFYCIGTMPQLLARQPPDPAERQHRVRFVLCSGIPAAAHAALEARWGCPWREAYGTTELGAVLFSPLDAAGDVGTGALGIPVRGKEVRVVGEDGRDAESGELWVRGEGLMRGYFDDAAATAAWCPDGWARTGDRVAREAGRIRFVARRRDVIRRGGQNISAAEVEAALADHPGVRIAACVAVPDEIYGEEVKAYVLQAAPGAVDPAALAAFVRERLAGWKTPRWIELVDELPMTPSERVAKHVLVAGRPDPRVGSFDTAAGRWFRP